MRGYIKTREEEKKKQNKAKDVSPVDDWVEERDGRYFNPFLKQYSKTKPAFVKVGEMKQ